MKRTLMTVLVLLAVVGFCIQNAAGFEFNRCYPYCKTLCYQVVETDTDGVLARPTYLKIYTGCDFLQLKTNSYDVRGMVWFEQLAGGAESLESDPQIPMTTLVVDGTLQKIDESWVLFLDGPSCTDGIRSPNGFEIYARFDGCPTSSSGQFLTAPGLTLEPISCWKLPAPVPPEPCVVVTAPAEG